MVLRGDGVDGGGPAGLDHRLTRCDTRINIPRSLVGIATLQIIQVAIEKPHAGLVCFRDMPASPALDRSKAARPQDHTAGNDDRQVERPGGRREHPVDDTRGQQQDTNLRGQSIRLEIADGSGGPAMADAQSTIVGPRASRKNAGAMMNSHSIGGLVDESLCNADRLGRD